MAVKEVEPIIGPHERNHYRKLELQKLRELEEEANKMLAQGDRPSKIAALNVLVKLSETRRSLMGLDVRLRPATQSIADHPDFPRIAEALKKIASQLPDSLRTQFQRQIDHIISDDETP